MAERIDDDTLEMNRRNVLKAVGAGVSLSAIHLLDEDEAQIGDITYNPEEEIPYVAGWSNKMDSNGEIVKEPFYKTMEVEKWDKMQATNDAIEETGELLQDALPQANDAFGILESIDNDSPTGRRLDVTLKEDVPYTEDEIRNLLPAQVTGQAEVSNETFEVPVGISKVEVNKDSHECYDTKYPAYDDVPGAAPIGVDEGDGVRGIGCTAGPYVHDDYGIGWITAKHVIDESVDDEVWQLEDEDTLGSVIGEVRDQAEETYNGDTWVDTAYILRTVSGKSPHEWIPNKDYTDNEDHPITIVIADTELKAQEGNKAGTSRHKGK
jgi:hypothetical protein